MWGTSRKRAHRAVLATTFVAASVLTFTAHGKNGGAPGLLLERSGQGVKTLPMAAVGKAKAVGINKAALRGGRLTITLPDGGSFEAVRKRHSNLGNGRKAWVGHAKGRPHDRVIIGANGDAVSATFYRGGKLFKLEPRADGTHVVSEVSAQQPAPEMDPIPVADKPSGKGQGGGNNGGGESESPTPTEPPPETTGPVVMDVLVAYTPAVAAIYGAQGAQALIIQAVAETNQAYINSGLDHRLNLVGAVSTNYTESGSMSTDLSRLKATSDNSMDELHSLRDSLGADLVSLLEHEPQYCGYAYRMTSMSTGFASSAFSVVHHGCATGYYSFAHEIGHNQGAHHDAENASGSMFDYGYGYQDQNSGFRTIMAYNCAGGCARIDHFSRSNTFFNGAPTGYANYTENALVIDETAATVAAFRATAEPSETPGVPAPPFELQLTPAGLYAMDLNWADNSDNESGFVIERYNDSTNAFEEVASLPVNTVSWRDEGLAANTLYSYKVKAWNSQGSSEFTTPAVAATEAAEVGAPPPGC